MIEELKAVGLTENESKVYLSLLKLGKSSIGNIIFDSNTTRSKIYDLLDKLIDKGLITQTIVDGTKTFMATNPESILDFIHSKKESLGRSEEKITKILPLLLQQQKVSDSKIELYTGIRGVEAAFERMTRKFSMDTEFLVLGGNEGQNLNWSKRFFSRLHNKRIEFNIKSRIIFTESARGKFNVQEKSKMNKVKYIQNMAPTAINIYKNVVIILIMREKPIATYYEDEDMAKSFTEYFTSLWKLAKN